MQDAITQDNQAIEAILAVKRCNGIENNSVQVLQNQTVNDAATAKEKSCKCISFAESMKRLSTIADVMHLTYIGTLHLPSSKSVVSMMTKFQRVVTDSNIACSKFVASSLSALEYYNEILRQQHLQESTVAFKHVGVTGKIAGEMSSISNDLVKQVISMCVLAEEVLDAVRSDDTISASQKEKITNMLAQNKAHREALKENIDTIRADLENATKNESMWGVRVDMTRNQESMVSYLPTALRFLSTLTVTFVLPALSCSVATTVGSAITVVSGLESAIPIVSDAIVREAIRESKIEEEYCEERVKLQEQKRKVAADLAEVLKGMDSMEEEVSKLDKVIITLKAVTTYLGQLATTFKDIYGFWEEIHHHCLQLENMSHEESNVNHVHDGMCIAQLWCSWVALCSINESARVAIETVGNDVKAVMNDLPTEEEANQRFSQVLNKLKLKIIDDIKYYETAQDKCGKKTSVQNNNLCS